MRQAEMTKAVDNSTRVFVYRNMVKALPVRALFCVYFCVYMCVCVCAW